MSHFRKVALAAVLAAACATPQTPAPETPKPAPAPAPASAPVPAPAKPAEAAPRVPVKGEEAIARQPSLPPLKEFEAPVPKLITLKNGLKLYVMERKGGIEALRLLVRRGASFDPERTPGLASMTAEMMEAGSAGKSQAEVAAAADALGATLGVEAGQDALTVGISGMTDKLPQMVKLLSDVALKPNMAPAEWKRLQEQRVAELVNARAHPRTGATLAFKAAAYGQHPLARPVEGTPESVRAMTLEEVKAFFGALSPDQAALVAVGGAPEAEVVKRLTDAFSGWKPKGPARAAAPARPAVPQERPRLVVVDYPQKPQAALLVGQPSVSRSSPDYLALTLLNSVLGGSFTSRLNQNLREQHGYTYGASSRFSFGADPGPFFAYAQVKTEVTGPALKEMLSEIGRAVSEPLSEEDISKGRALLAYDLVQMLEHADSAAGGISALYVYDLPLDEYRTFVNRLKALTAKDVQAAAQRALQPGTMTVVVAGDRKAVEAQLKGEASLALPAPQLRDAEGKLVPPGAGSRG